MQTIMASVIVLTYNQQAYIGQALDSILMQKTRFPYEILVGDDASIDKTGSIVRSYAQAYPQIIRPFIRERNLGVTRNLYELLKHTRGKYIASCEGDDFWTDPEKLELQIDFLENHSEYSGCTHNARVIDENGGLLGPEPEWVCQTERFTRKDFDGVHLPGQPATLVHRNFFLDKAHDYSIIYEANPMVADRTMVLILALQGAIYRLRREMSCYRRLTGTSQSVTSKMFQNNQNVNQMQFELTKCLERYAKDEYGIKINVTRFKLEQFVKWKIKAALRTLSLWGKTPE